MRLSLPAPLGVDPGLFQHTAIRASAGSGKTFQLTNRYLQLIAAGAEPSSILASTFTRLAAGQIRDRILLRLAKAADDPKERRELGQHLGVAALARQPIIDVLASLAGNIHQMQIRTLDSFFAGVVRMFAIELGLPLGAEVVDEAQEKQMRAEAIRLMLDERQPQDLVDLLRLLTQGSAQRGVMNTINQVVDDLYSLYREADDHAWESVPQVAGRLPPAKLAQAIATVEQAACGDDKRFSKAFVEDCTRARNRDWEAFLGGGLAKAIASGADSYYKKTIDPSLSAAYRPVVGHAIAELIGRVRDQTIATRDLLRLFDAHYEKVKHRRGAVTFADLTAAMIKAEQLGKLEEIGFRLDAHLHHLLLDEFQDTSIPQWRALEPIAREMIGYLPSERTFFCVGDVKQSIYGWRHAAPEVLDELPHLLSGPDGSSAITQMELARSYRSAQPIIDVVNSVFESIQANEALSEFPDAVAAWRSGFAHHETAKTELAGYAELRTARRAGEDEEKNAIRFELAAKLAGELHQRNPDLKIAILTRTNDAVAHLLYELGPSRLNVPASGRGGGPLTDAAPVNALLDLLHLADHPDDTAAAFNVATSPAGKMIGLSDYRSRSDRERIAHEVRATLLHEGYGRTIADWAARLAPACDQRELRRLLQLVELAGTHDDQSTLRPGDFVRLVEQSRIEDVQPAPVQVMTIHQSKGLEFDAVVLPELESQLTGPNTPPVVFERDGETGPITRICRYMNKDVLALAPHLQPLFDRHTRRAVRESLSLLYVAMTRAIHALYMIIDPPAENERSIPKKLSGVLRSALGLGDNQPESVLWEHGDRNWLAKTPSPATKSIPKPPPVGTIKLAPSQDSMIRGQAFRAASAASLKPTADSFQLRLPDSESRDCGIVMHALLTRIQWLEDFQPDVAELTSVAIAYAPRRDAKWARRQVDRFLKKIITQPAVAQALSLNGENRSLRRVYREHQFARLIGGKIQIGSIDRLVVEYDPLPSHTPQLHSRPRSACVIDFKSDLVQEQTDARDCAQRYRGQLESYRAAVVETCGLSETSIIMQVVFAEAGRAIEL